MDILIITGWQTEKMLKNWKQISLETTNKPLSKYQYMLHIAHHFHLKLMYPQIIRYIKGIRPQIDRYDKSVSFCKLTMHGVYTVMYKILR